MSSYLLNKTKFMGGIANLLLQQQEPQLNLYPLVSLKHGGQYVIPGNFKYIEFPQKIQKILIPLELKTQVDFPNETSIPLTSQEVGKIFDEYETKVISVQVKSLLNNEDIDFNRGPIDRELFDIIIFDLLKEASGNQISLDFYEKFNLYIEKVGGIKVKYSNILFKELCHVVNSGNMAREIDNESGSKFFAQSESMLFHKRNDDVIRFKNTLENFQDGGNKVVDIDYISLLVTNKLKFVEGLNPNIQVQGSIEENGKVNLFLFNVILNNIISNFRRYGLNGTFNIIFSEDGIFINVINQKKEVNFHGTQMGKGIIESCISQVGGGVNVEETEGFYSMKVNMNYSKN